MLRTQSSAISGAARSTCRAKLGPCLGPLALTLNARRPKVAQSKSIVVAACSGAGVESCRELQVILMVASSPRFLSLTERNSALDQGTLRVFALSDLHTHHSENMAWVNDLDRDAYTNDVLIVAGDISDDIEELKWVRARRGALSRPHGQCNTLPLSSHDPPLPRLPSGPRWRCSSACSRWCSSSRATTNCGCLATTPTARLPRTPPPPPALASPPPRTPRSQHQHPYHYE